MRKSIIKAISILTFGASSVLMAAGALAEEWPLVGGDYWEVTGIDIKDGGSWKYVNWLATEWRKDLEFAKSKGWIKDYMIIGNVHGRSGNRAEFREVMSTSLLQVFTFRN